MQPFSAYLSQIRAVRRRREWALCALLGTGGAAALSPRFSFLPSEQRARRAPAEPGGFREQGTKVGTALAAPVRPFCFLSAFEEGFFPCVFLGFFSPLCCYFPSTPSPCSSSRPPAVTSGAVPSPRHRGVWRSLCFAFVWQRGALGSARTAEDCGNSGRAQGPSLRSTWLCCSWGRDFSPVSEFRYLFIWGTF